MSSQLSELKEKLFTDQNKAALLIALAVVILIVLILVMRGKEHLTDGSGYPYAYGAASPLRGWADYPQSGISHGAYNRKQQEFSMPRQGDVETVSAMQVKAVEDLLTPRGLYPENLTGTRGAPDFWEVPEELRKSQSQGITGKEHLASAPQGIIGGNNTFPWKDTDSYVYPMTY